MVIKDECMHSFQIHKDSHGCTVHKASGKLNKDNLPVLTTVGHYATIVGAGKKVCDELTKEGIDNTVMKAHIDRLEKVRNNVLGRLPEMEVVLRQVDDITNKLKLCEKALKEIAERKGRYSKDPLTHADNTIEDMGKLADDALLIF